MTTKRSNQNDTILKTINLLLSLENITLSMHGMNFDIYSKTRFFREKLTGFNSIISKQSRISDRHYFKIVNDNVISNYNSISLIFRTCQIVVNNCWKLNIVICFNKCSFLSLWNALISQTEFQINSSKSLYHGGFKHRSHNFKCSPAWCVCLLPLCAETIENQKRFNLFTSICKYKYTLWTIVSSSIL